MAEIDHLKGLFESQKEHLDYRFDELHKDLDECKGKHCARDKVQDERITKLEGQKKVNYGVSAIGGVIGGIITMGSKILWPGGS